MEQEDLNAITAAVSAAVAPLETRVAALESPTKRPNIITRIHNSIKGYRTIIVAGALAVMPTLVNYFASPEIQSQLGLSPRTAIILSGLFMTLRIITKGPVPLLKS